MVNASMFPNLFRAIEIAKLGGHSLAVVFDSYAYKTGFDDFELVKDAVSGWFDDFVSVEDADMKVEIVKPSKDAIMLKTGLSIDDVKERVNAVLENAKPPIKIEQSSQALIDTAMKRLNIGLLDYKRITEIAQTIAQFDGSSNIKIEHVAEAIHYVAPNEDCTDATDKFISFGSSIRIKHGDIGFVDIENAINYLQSLNKL